MTGKQRRRLNVINAARRHKCAVREVDAHAVVRYAEKLLEAQVPGWNSAVLRQIIAVVEEGMDAPARARKDGN